VVDPEGRLELTWTNKSLRLLAHEDGSYEWVETSDYRVAEVRLFQDLTTVGGVGKRRAADNLLIRGDALNALTSLGRLPEFAREYLGKVKLVYIDPPFNTQQSFLHYDDALEHSVWLTMIRDRLLQIRDLLAPDGTVWLHLDDAEVHRARNVLDEVFGDQNFVATVIWEKTTSARNDAKLFSTDQDYLLVYAKESERFRPNKVAHSEASDKAYTNPDNDPRGRWREVDYKGPKTATERPNLYYPLIHPRTGKEVWPRRERVWAYGREEHERHMRENLLWWGKTGNYKFPKLKRFLSDRSIEGTPPRTLWTGDEVDTSRRAKDEIKKLFPTAMPFTTPKPERLLKRVLHVASNPNDIVLDCFLGSGTTAAVAHKMARRWVGIEMESNTVEDYVVPRLTKVVNGDDPGGITDEVDWNGGGGFRVLEVSPSMFIAEEGMVFLAESMTNSKLAEATAAQLGFVYETDPPFCGRKGRSRLAVVDGVVNESVVRLLVSALPEGERVVICGTGIDTDARPVLRELRSGSTLRKIPATLLDEFRSSRQLRLALDVAEPEQQEEVIS
jgi:adenine-specific DNA-methyltransferase